MSSPRQYAESILVVEDEMPMRTVLARSLKRRGYKVTAVANGISGLVAVSKETPDLVLLDIMMPKLDGFSFCREVRRSHFHVPILILTAKGDVDDRVHGLDVGADDYLVKPFNLEELLARIRALLRRAQSRLSQASQLTLGKITIDFQQQQAWQDGHPIHLTAKEIAALHLFSQNPRTVITRQRFLQEVWGYRASLETRTVDRHINSLRAKIEPDPDCPQWIKTVHGGGYRFDPPK